MCYNFFAENKNRRTQKYVAVRYVALFMPGFVSVRVSMRKEIGNRIELNDSTLECVRDAASEKKKLFNFATKLAVTCMSPVHIGAQRAH